MPLFGRHEPLHVSFEKQNISKCAKQSEWRFPGQFVAHERAAVARLERVYVSKPAKGAVNHLVDETARPIDLGDPRDEALAHAEVPAFERNEIAELEKSAHPSGRDEPLAGEFRALRVGSNIASEIETDFDGCLDEGLDDDLGHESAHDHNRLRESLIDRRFEFGVRFSADNLLHDLHR